MNRSGASAGILPTDEVLDEKPRNDLRLSDPQGLADGVLAATAELAEAKKWSALALVLGLIPLNLVSISEPT
jgi:hypothetical protein